jgi:hypothetical protein
MNLSFTIGVCLDIDTKLDEQVVLERISKVVDTMKQPLEMFENSLVDEIYADVIDVDEYECVGMSISIGEVMIDKEIDDVGI